MKFDSVIIDGDPLVYRCGFSIQKYDSELDILRVEPAKHAFYNINSMMRKILNKTGAEKYEAYLTSNDRTNFRFELFPDYKANRKDSIKPVHYNSIREFMIKRWGAQVISGQEADDACSISHCAVHKVTGFQEFNTTSIVASFDKDFNNIPGWHYNFIKDIIYFVSEIEALRNFYLQILTGDTSDGIPRIKKGWRQTKAAELIQEAKKEDEIVEIVRNEIYTIYNKDNISIEDVDKLINDRGKLVWLRREVDELWHLPTQLTQSKL